MKNRVIALSLLGLMLMATPALGKSKDDKSDDDHGLKLGQIKNWFNSDSSQFVVMGTVESVGTNSFVVKANGLLHVPNVTNNMVTIKVDSNTKFSGTGNDASISTTSVGKNVLATGKVTGTDLFATKVIVNGEKADKIEVKKKAMGTITEKTDTSITVKNSVTGESKTITTNANTQVKVDGEVKTVADVQVGDRGWVKFKTVGTTLIAKIVHLFR